MSSSEPQLPQTTGEALVKALQKQGFEVARQQGSHVQTEEERANAKHLSSVFDFSGKIG